MTIKQIGEARAEPVAIARVVARLAHHEQFDKLGVAYMHHVEEVAARVLARLAYHGQFDKLGVSYIYYVEDVAAWVQHVGEVFEIVRREQAYGEYFTSSESTALRS